MSGVQVAEADGAEHFLGTVHNQFRPDTDQEEVVPPGKWPQLAPVLAEEEESDTFSWLDLDPKGTALLQTTRDIYINIIHKKIF